MNVLIEQFLGYFAEKLDDMTDEEFQVLKQTQSEILKIKDVTLFKRSNEIWQQIVEYQDYELKSEMIEELEKMEK